MARTLKKGDYDITNVSESDVRIQPTDKPGVVNVRIRVKRSRRSMLKQKPLPSDSPQTPSPKVKD